MKAFHNDFLLESRPVACYVVLKISVRQNIILPKSSYLGSGTPQEAAAGCVKSLEGGGEGIQATAQGVGHRPDQALANTSK